MEHDAYNRVIEKDKKELIKRQKKANSMEKKLARNIINREKHEDPEVWEEKCVKIYD